MYKRFYTLIVLLSLSQLNAGGHEMNALCQAIIAFDVREVQNALQINAFNTNYVHDGPYGASPLIAVCYRAYENDAALDIIQILLNHGADLRPTKYNVTPLHAIVLGFSSNLESGDFTVLAKRCRKAIDLLFQSLNDDLEKIDALSLARNKTGQTALEIAFEHGLAVIVDKLLCYTSENVHTQLDVAKLLEQNRRKQESFTACAKIIDEMNSIAWQQ